MKRIVYNKEVWISEDSYNKAIAKERERIKDKLIKYGICGKRVGISVVGLYELLDIPYNKQKLKGG